MDAKTHSSPAPLPPDLFLKAIELEAHVRDAARDPDAIERRGLHASYPEELTEYVPDIVKQFESGCADVTADVRPGDHLLDLGCGSGMTSFVASQRAGTDGFVLGLDCDRALVTLADQASSQFGFQVGVRNLQFSWGRMQDLRLDLEVLDGWLEAAPPKTVEELAEVDVRCAAARLEEPALALGEFDHVVINGSLNLVNIAHRHRVLTEALSALKPGGQLTIADVVSNHLAYAVYHGDLDLWADGQGGAFDTALWIEMLNMCGFDRVDLSWQADKPWRVHQHLTFIPTVLKAFKPATPRPAGPIDWSAYVERVFYNPFDTEDSAPGSEHVGAHQPCDPSTGCC